MAKTKKKKRNKSSNKNKGKAIQIIQKLHASNFKNREHLTDLRYTLSFDDAKTVVAHNLPKYIIDELFEEPLPMCYEAMRKKDNCYHYMDNPKKELQWYTLTILKFSAQINEFLAIRQSFESHFLRGNYNEATDCLNKVEESICFSLWGLENRFLITEYSKGTEKNLEFLGEVTGKKLETLMWFFADYSSKRAEENLSITKYCNYFDQLVYAIKDKEKLLGYLKYRLNEWAYPQTKNYGYILFEESRLSVLDRYLSFRKIIQRLCLDHDAGLRGTVQACIRQLTNVINDPSLKRLDLFFDPNHPIGSDSLANRFLQISDEYTMGNYGISCQLAREEITGNVDCIELYNIYLKSLISTEKKGVDNFFRDGSFADKILKAMFDVLHKNENTIKSGEKIGKIIYTLNNFDFAFQLNYFLDRNLAVSVDMNQRLNSMLMSRFSHAKHSVLYQDKKDSVKYLSNLSEFKANSITVDFWRKFQANDVEGLKVLNVPIARHKIYEARSLIKLEHFNKAIEVYKELIYGDEAARVYARPYVYEEVIRNYFECLLNERMLVDASKLVVMNYMINKYIVIKLDLSRLLSLIKSSPDKNNIYKEISTANLFYIATEKREDRYIAYDSFMYMRGCHKPSDFMHTVTDFPNNLVVFFLDKVCNLPVLYSGALHYDGTEDVENERIHILQKLSDLDSSNADKYAEEINAITRRIMIRKGIQQIDESKIYVDREGIKKVAESSVLESFNRYREYSSFKKDIKVIDTSQGLRLQVYDSRFLLFMEIFLELRDMFISGKEYGLDSYLSVRIRHGTFSGQIRSPFEAKKIITSKSPVDESSYLKNEYWEKQLLVDDPKIQENLQKFSQEIDGLIQCVRDEWIQVKTERKKTQGLFDFSYSPSRLYYTYREKFREIIDYNLFVDEILNELFERTEQVLKTVRQKIQGDFGSKLLGCLSELGSFFSRHPEKEKFMEISRSIVSCKTSLQNELERVSN